MASASLGKRLQSRRGGGRSAPTIVSVATIIGIGICLSFTLMALGWSYIVSSSVSVHHNNVAAHDVSNLHTSMRRRRTASDVPKHDTADTSKKIDRPVAKLKLPTPILVMGLPKSGTTSITSYFKCGNIKASHFSCEVNDDDDLTRPWRNCLLPKGGAGGPDSDGSNAPLCSVCIERNILHGRPPLEGCGFYSVFGEFDSAEHPLPIKQDDSAANKSPNVNPLCSFPQITYLNEIHKAYPNATFILNLRPVENWIRSVSTWNPTPNRADKGYLRRVLTQCDLPGFASGIGEVDGELAAFYHAQSERIRSFVRQHPSHSLVEVNIEQENAGRIMEEAFGINQQCWGKQNAATPTAQHPNRTHTEPKDSEGGKAASAIQSARILGEPQQDTHVVTKKHNFTEAMAQVQSMADLMFAQYTQSKLIESDLELALDYPECSDIEDIFPPRRGQNIQ